MQKTLYFSATATWVTDAVCEDIPKYSSAKIEVRRTGRHNSGSLVLTADTEGELDKAVAYIARDSLYKYHFKSAQG
jgi:hypothetical protein